MRQFKYLYETTATGFLDIDDPANTCIYVTNDLFQEYILIIQTKLGRTKVIQYGPNYVDLDKVPSNVSCNYQEFDISDYKIDAIIDKFLNKTRASQAIEIELEEAKDKIKNMRDFIDDTEGKG